MSGDSTQCSPVICICDIQHTRAHFLKANSRPTGIRERVWVSALKSYNKGTFTPRHRHAWCQPLLLFFNGMLACIQKSLFFFFSILVIRKRIFFFSHQIQIINTNQWDLFNPSFHFFSFMKGLPWVTGWISIQVLRE